MYMYLQLSDRWAGFMGVVFWVYFVMLQVAEGQEVCILEAMKMQNSMTSTRVAKVSNHYYHQKKNEKDFLNSTCVNNFNF